MQSKQACLWKASENAVIHTPNSTVCASNRLTNGKETRDPQSKSMRADTTEQQEESYEDEYRAGHTHFRCYVVVSICWIHCGLAHSVSLVSH